MEEVVVKKKVIDKMVKVIARFGDIQIKHSITLNYKNPINRNDPVLQNFAYGYKNIRKVEKVNTYNMMYKTYDNISIEAVKKMITDPSDPNRKILEKGIPNSCFISYNDCVELEMLLNEGEKWLVSDKYKDIFGYTDSGKPYRINHNFSKLHYIMYPKVGMGKFLLIQPFIIQEMNNSYTGIIVKTERGVLGMLTCSEFLNMRKVLINLTNSLYSDSLNLLNMGLVHNLD